MTLNRKLDHLGLGTPDAKKTADWYVEVLNWHIAGQFKDNGGNDVYFAANEDESVVYEIYPMEVADNQKGWFNHICYQTDDVEADYKYCVEKGYEITTDGIEGIPTFWENGVRYFKIRSVSGEEVEFCQKM